jgi:eukaryotic-like serine/threonine-protein kinase
VTLAELTTTASSVLRRVLRPGSFLGGYRIVADLGRGGMGDVFLAVKRGPDAFEKLVVLKTLKSELSRDASCVAMFLDEARLTARLNHPHIAQTNEAGAEDNTRYISMEYLDGQPLHTVRRVAQGHKDLRAVELRILLEMLRALGYAHAFRGDDGECLGIVHRDATPHNMFVTYEGIAKLVDFGIAKTRLAVDETATGVLKGKLRYVSPEQALGGKVDRRSDLFTIGVVLWEALCGERFADGLGDGQFLQRLLAGDVPPIADGAVPENMRAVCMQALARNPEDRFQTAEDFHDALEAACHAWPGAAMSQRAVAQFLEGHFAESRAAFDKEVATTLSEIRGSLTVSASTQLAPASDGTETRVTAETVVDGPARPRSAFSVALPWGILLVVLGLLTARSLRSATQTSTVDAPARPAVVSVRPLDALTSAAPSTVASAAAVPASESAPTASSAALPLAPRPTKPVPSATPSSGIVATVAPSVVGSAALKSAPPASGTPPLRPIDTDFPIAKP